MRAHIIIQHINGLTYSSLNDIQMKQSCISVPSKKSTNELTHFDDDEYHVQVFLGRFDVLNVNILNTVRHLGCFKLTEIQWKLSQYKNFFIK